MSAVMWLRSSAVPRLMLSRASDWLPFDQTLAPADPNTSSAIAAIAASTIRLIDCMRPYSDSFVRYGLDEIG